MKSLLREDSDYYSGLREAAFSLAVRMHAGDIAQLLLHHGADSSQCRPDELVALRDAVDSGSPALVEALLDHGIRARYPESELLEMRELACRWHEAGVEAELRRRTGSSDQLVRTQVQDDEHDTVSEFALGGMSVRNGHSAILTDVEELLGIRASFEELMARALAHDPDHSAWGRAVLLLAGRRDHVTWEAAAALRTHPEPSHRLFGAEVLRFTHLFDDRDEDAFAAPALEIFTEWSADETDLAVLTRVLGALGQHADVRAEATLVAYADHADAGVRRTVADGFGTSPERTCFPDDVRKALLVLMTDADATVRRHACIKVAESRDRDPVLAHAMAALLDDADREVQVVAVHGLAHHDDERCVEAARRLGPPQPGSLEEEDYLFSARRYEWRRDGL
ncbi:hypothetical protein [Streptomyces sp. NPDC058401]|uniref:HEAT repeat domain-containing protein n=1 Tax=Streptomyces sp. NPDC058401 TaxID=3346480 RepID=UPI00365C42B7